MNEFLDVDASILDGSTAKLLFISLNQKGSTAKAVKADMLQVKIESFADGAALLKLSVKP